MNTVSKRGLTLVEMLAAVVLLSAVTGACISILQDAARTTTAMPLDLEAAAALEAWSLQPSGGGESATPPDLWAWVAPSGNEWSVADLVHMAAPPSEADAANEQTASLRIGWTRVTLTCDSAHEQNWVFWLAAPPLEANTQ
jgi:prepilin-type N-terminal cleavage/methylation domain-containing protein